MRRLIYVHIVCRLVKGKRDVQQSTLFKTFIKLKSTQEIDDYG